MIIGKREHISLVTLKLNLIGHVAKKTRFVLVDNCDDFPCNNFKFIINAFIELSSLMKDYTMVKTLTVLTGSAFYDRITVLMFKAAQK